VTLLVAILDPAVAADMTFHFHSEKYRLLTKQVYKTARTNSYSMLFSIIEAAARKITHQ
jgi:hypothetical protein